MVGAQSGLFYWKKQHKRSYELVGHMAGNTKACLLPSSDTILCLHAGDTAWPLAGSRGDQCIHDLVEVCPGKLQC